MKISDERLMKAFDVQPTDIEYTVKDKTTRIYKRGLELSDGISNGVMIFTFTDHEATVELQKTSIADKTGSTIRISHVTKPLSLNKQLTTEEIAEHFIQKTQKALLDFSAMVAFMVKIETKKVNTMSTSDFIQSLNYSLNDEYVGRLFENVDDLDGGAFSYLSEYDDNTDDDYE